jgi:hypothetical protein
VAQSKGSTDFLLIVATESFLHGGTYAIPGFAMATWDLKVGGEFFDDLASKMILAAAPEAALRWERLDLDECLAVYGNTRSALTSRRHVVMVVSNEGESRTDGWLGNGTINSLWGYEFFHRTDKWIGELARYRSMDGPDYESELRHGTLNYYIDIDIASGPIKVPVESFNKTQAPNPPAALQVHYCLSEPFIVPCEVQAYNMTLLVVLLCCLVKATGCLIALIRLRRQDPLLTPGDAIQSFITNPDKLLPECVG